MAAAAMVALRAAALLRGGVPLARVWEVLGEEGDAGDADAHDGPAWRVIAAGWRLAEWSGAPIAVVLERIAVALTSLDRLQERRSVPLAGPRATIRLVASLPPFALLLSWVMGFDPTPVLFGPVGGWLVAGGVGLLLIGVRWARLMVAKLASADCVVGLECELAWAALAGGAAPSAAIRRVVDCVTFCQAHWVRLSTLGREGSVRRVLERSASLGTPAGPMLLAEADRARAQALVELEREAESVAVRVLLPVGLCVLPSFILLGVLPVVFAVMGTFTPL